MPEARRRPLETASPPCPPKPQAKARKQKPSPWIIERDDKGIPFRLRWVG